MDAQQQLSASSVVAKPLDAMTIPLFGRTLIEASAGTGKTYTLSFLYLRLLLGLGENSYLRPLNVDEILVVTFTRAATEELRYRIRQNIHQLRIACIRGQHSDPLYQQLLAQIEDRQYAQQLLLFAEQQMDLASIYTIHGFCQRTLTSNAFESGQLFEQRLLQDERQLRLHVVRDLWRRYFYPLSESLIYVLQQTWPNPEALLYDIQPYLSEVLPDDTSPCDIIACLNQHHADCLARIENVKSHWLMQLDSIAALIQQSGVNKRSYSSKNLPLWLAQVTEWAKQPTRDYQLPEKLAVFSQSVLIAKSSEGQAPQHTLFAEIEQLCDYAFDIKRVILFDLIKLAQQLLQQEKLRRAEIGFDDLLQQLYQALNGSSGEQLAQTLAKHYPVAMIDEFQDTDPLQYQIFDRIYQDRRQTGLLFIGDPKQAIYGFRGADIFTYIQAKQQIDHHFTMAVNWRSSAAMVQAVNQLFSAHSPGFIFEAIPFFTIQAAKQHQHKYFELHGQMVNAGRFCLLPESISTVGDYRQASAQHCAHEIVQWLLASEQQQAWLVDGPEPQQRRPLTAADIAILVRKGDEAEVIQQALASYGIRSVYLSNRKSVFESMEAKALLWILQAVLRPQNELYLRTALSTPLLGITMAELDAYQDEQTQWEAIIEEFLYYQECWLRHGVLAMLRALMSRRHVAENLLAQAQGERMLTNLMHLGELLQSAAGELESTHALLRWFNRQIIQPDPNMADHQQRLESDENLVKIITIHKSKGLEYPLVWLPFICHYQQSDKQVYHDRQSLQRHYVTQVDEISQQLIEEERLAEDLRLLYVAMTRSVYHCSLGIAGLRSRRGNETNLHQAAFGYLVQAQQAGDYAFLLQQLQRLAAFELQQITPTAEVQPLNLTVPAARTLAVNRFSRTLEQRWRLTSYSGLNQHAAYPAASQITDELLPYFDAEVIESTAEPEELLFAEAEMVAESESTLSIHQLAKGAKVGTLLHSLFEALDFTQYQPQQLQHCDALHKFCLQLKLDEAWRPVLTQWLHQVLTTPLNEHGLQLSQITDQQKLIELQFYLPIRQPLIAQQLDHLAKQYDPLSAKAPALDFNEVEGMLKGFIDLVFEANGRFYVLDYKSNWLGTSAAHYHQSALAQAMIEHRYDLQYQLYSLALHRYLQQRLPNYDYQRHFGGVFYLFLRGISANLPGNGIFFTKPDPQFIEQLDQLFG